MGPHAVFIWSSYALVTVVLGALVAWLVVDGRRLARELAALDERSAGRGPAVKGN